MIDSLYKVAQADWSLHLAPEECFTLSGSLEPPGLPNREEYGRWYGKNSEYHPWPELYYIFDGSEHFGWGEETGRIKDQSALLIQPY